MYPNFEQKYYSRTAKGIYTITHDGIRLMKWMAYYDRYSENINYFHLIGSVVAALTQNK